MLNRCPPAPEESSAGSDHSLATGLPPDRAAAAAGGSRDLPRRSPLQGALLRVAALLIAAVPLALLVLAGQLEPSSSGIGTHQQLGLPPCSMLFVLGVRCPSCGMTTSWAHFARGQWLDSLRAHPGGFLLACLGLFVAWLSLAACWRAEVPSHRTQLIVTSFSVGIVVVTLLDWLARLVLDRIPG